MIIGGSKKEVINNIKTNIEHNELNKKVEIGDPELSNEELDKLIIDFYNDKKKLSYISKTKQSVTITNQYLKLLNKYIEVDGLENIKGIKNGIITNNHFNPLDSLVVRKITNKLHKKLYIVSENSNLGMDGLIGYVLRYTNIIPLPNNIHLYNKLFKPDLIKSAKKSFVLIYPEEEMWFNYKKPRPCKRGAYQFAAEANVPIIPCFTEMITLDNDDNEEFKQVKYIVHILKPIYPDQNKSIRQNSIDNCELDYKLKCECYKNCYKKEVDYSFNYDDIAGFKYDK